MGPLENGCILSFDAFSYEDFLIYKYLFIFMSLYTMQSIQVKILTPLPCSPLLLFSSYTWRLVKLARFKPVWFTTASAECTLSCCRVAHWNTNSVFFPLGPREDLVWALIVKVLENWDVYTDVIFLVCLLQKNNNSKKTKKKKHYQCT